jgi:hypothetical protein
MLWTNLPGDAFQFLTASLLAIAITVATRLRNEGRPTSGNVLIGFALLAYGIALLRHYGPVEPSAGSLLVTLIGFAFGTFTARFIWGLIGPDFSAKDALMAAGGLILISIAYSLPVYYRDFSLLLHGLSISSLKTPVAEVTFAERADRHGAQGVGELAGPVFSSGVPHPSDPTPALYYLTRDLSTDKEERGYRPWDRDYIAFFNPPGRAATNKNSLWPSIVTTIINMNSRLTNECSLVDSNQDFVPAKPLLQPYTAIALSSLLAAHDATDAGIDVLAKWLDIWRCARPDPVWEGPGKGSDAQRKLNPLKPRSLYRLG